MAPPDPRSPSLLHEVEGGLARELPVLDRVEGVRLTESNSDARRIRRIRPAYRPTAHKLRSLGSNFLGSCLCLEGLHPSSIRYWFCLVITCLCFCCCCFVVLKHKILMGSSPHRCRTLARRAGVPNSMFLSILQIETPKS